jgi:hypothetical protein
MSPASESVAQQVLQTANVTVTVDESRRHSFGTDSQSENESTHQLHHKRAGSRSTDGGQPSSLNWSRNPSLPAFVKPLSGSLKPEAWDYLVAKSCFTFPPLALQKLVMKRYIEYVYPLLPVTSIEDHVSIYSGKPMNSGVSLTLYHALLGAGLAAVEDEAILRFGYPSKAAARGEFYTRARVSLVYHSVVCPLLTSDCESRHCWTWELKDSA